MGTGKRNGEDILRWTSIPSRGSGKTPNCFKLSELRQDKLCQVINCTEIRLNVTFMVSLHLQARSVIPPMPNTYMYSYTVGEMLLGK